MLSTDVFCLSYFRIILIMWVFCCGAADVGYLLCCLSIRSTPGSIRFSPGSIEFLLYGDLIHCLWTFCLQIRSCLSQFERRVWTFCLQIRSCCPHTLDTLSTHQMMMYHTSECVAHSKGGECLDDISQKWEELVFCGLCCFCNNHF